MHSCRNVLLNINDLEAGENASLLMSRYVRNLDDDKENARMQLFDAMESAAKNAKEFYAQAFSKRHKLLNKIALSRNFETIQPLAAGLGNTSVIETGISLNSTFGLPMIPGSSIKGITAHYYAENFGKNEFYNAIFGAASQDDEQQGGILRFYDAWLLPECAGTVFVDDVMTPHNMKYYSGEKYPSDFEDPNPVRFLAVNGKFEFLIGAENFEVNKNESDKKWIEFAFDILESALKNFGIGGKLHAGYGKMKSILSQEQLEAKNLEAKRAQNLKDGFSHSEGEILDVVCSKIKIDNKGREKRTFNFVEGDDKISVNFQPIPKIDEGTVIKAKILRLQKGANKAYILQAL